MGEERISGLGERLTDMLYVRHGTCYSLAWFYYRWCTISRKSHGPASAKQVPATEQACFLGHRGIDKQHWAESW